MNKVLLVGFLIVLVGAVVPVLADFTFLYNPLLTLLAQLQAWLAALFTFVYVLLGNVPCEYVFNTVLAKLPDSIQANLSSFSLEDKCSTLACGQSDGSGYWDIYCKGQCLVAGYANGVCANTGSVTTCTCDGPNGNPNIQTVYTMCQLLGSCACQTCPNGTMSGVNWEQGTCSYIYDSDHVTKIGVQNTCS